MPHSVLSHLWLVLLAVWLGAEPESVATTRQSKAVTKAIFAIEIWELGQKPVITAGKSED